MAKKEEPKKEATTAMLQVVQEGGGSVLVPEWAKEFMGKGTEHFTKDDLQMPRLGLAQGLSPQLNPDKPEFIKGLVLGDAFNSATNTIYGRGPWEVAIVRVYPPRWVEFIPREEGGGVKDPNVPYNDPRTQWGPGGQKPVATKYYDFVAIFLESKESIALSFKATGIRVAKKLNTLIAKRGLVPLFMGKYQLRAVMTKNSKGDYATLQVTNNGHIEEETLLRHLASQFNYFKDKEVVIDREPGSDDDEAEADM